MEHLHKYRHNLPNVPIGIRTWDTAGLLWCRYLTWEPKPVAFIPVGTHPQLSLPHFDWSRENLTNVTKIDLPTLCNRNKQTSTQRLCDRNRQAHNVRATEIDNHAHHGKVGQPLMPNCDNIPPLRKTFHPRWKVSQQTSSQLTSYSRTPYAPINTNRVLIYSCSQPLHYLYL